MDRQPITKWEAVQAESGDLYQNLQFLGSGGNATTFLAIANSGPNCGVLFAVKAFRTLSKPERRDSFLKEIGFLKGCNHPSVMRVFDSGVHRGEYPFLVAEYLPRTLQQVIRGGDTSQVVKVSYAMQLLSALTYLQRLNPPVVHRDIKPQNIFIKGNSCVLGDFGLLKHIGAESADDRDVLKESVGVGMPFRYRTPDQVAYLRNEAPLSASSDIFQLGLVLAELFTGRNPELPSRDFADPVQLEKLGWVRGALGGAIADVIRGMLEMDPAVRGDAAKFLDLWKGIFLAAAKRADALEGRVIW